MTAGPGLLMVVGCARSGTTLVSRMLGGHPHVTAVPETKYLQYVYSQRHLLRLLPARERAVRIVDCLVQAEYPREEPVFPSRRGELLKAVRSSTDLLDCFWRLLETLGDSPLVLEKTPWHTVFMPMLARRRPDLRFVAVTRDCPAVVASLLGREGMRWSGRLMQGVARWLLLNRTILRCEERLPPGRLVRMRMEDVVREPEAEMERLCDLLGLEPAPGMLQPSVRDSSHAAGPWCGGMDRGVLERWRGVLSSEETGLVLALSAPTAARLGYERSPGDLRRTGIRARLSLAWEMAMHRMAIALMRSGLYPVGALGGGCSPPGLEPSSGDDGPREAETEVGDDVQRPEEEHRQRHQRD